jgi:hypothetical protein
LRRETLVVVPEPAEIAASLLIGEPLEKGFPVRVSTFDSSFSVSIPLCA